MEVVSYFGRSSRVENDIHTTIQQLCQAALFVAESWQCKSGVITRRVFWLKETKKLWFWWSPCAVWEHGQECTANSLWIMFSVRGREEDLSRFCDARLRSAYWIEKLSGIFSFRSCVPLSSCQWSFNWLSVLSTLILLWEVDDRRELVNWYVERIITIASIPSFTFTYLGGNAIQCNQ